MDPNQINISNTNKEWDMTDVEPFSEEQLAPTGENESQFGEGVHELEEFFYENDKTYAGVKTCISDAVGVCMDVKPATILGILSDEREDAKLDKLIELYKNLGLETVVDEHIVLGEENINYTYLYASKDKAKAERLRDVHFAILESPAITSERSQNDREMGRLLGYPESAIEYFARWKHNPSREMHSFDGYSTYIMHDPAHIEEEFNQYERPIYNTLQKFAPRAYQDMLAPPQLREIDAQKLKKQKLSKLKRNILELFSKNQKTSAPKES